jgi:hypothetical protein
LRIKNKKQKKKRGRSEKEEGNIRSAEKNERGTNSPPDEGGLEIGMQGGEINGGALP